MERKILKAISQIAFFVYNRVASLFLKTDKYKVVFASEARDALKGNLKAVCEALPAEYKPAVHLKEDRRDCNSFFETMRLWKDLTTAGYIFLDDFYGIVSAMRVRKEQQIVQLWHGSGAFKKFGFSRIGTGDNIKKVHRGYRKYTKVAVTAEEIRQCFAEAFDVGIDKVKAVGSPRTDVFFDEESREDAVKRVRRALPQLQGKKIVLVAPTYRGRKVEDATYAFEKLDLQGLAYELGEDYALVTRWHPALYSNIKRGICSLWTEGITDASEYEEINDLLIAADVLITDYSSVIFDWYLLSKPVIYFVYDLGEYEKGRGLYYDFYEYVYGAVVESSSQLPEAIRKGDMCEDARDSFGRKFMSACDGKSTKRVIEWVFGREEK